MTGVLEVDVIQVVHDGLVTRMPGVRVLTRTGTDLADVLPTLQVLRTGGPDDGYVLDIPTLALHGFAATDQAANALLYQTGTALRAMDGVVIDGAVITRVVKIGGPSWAPYTNLAVRHAVSLYQLYIKAA